MAYLDVAAHDVLDYVHPSTIPAPPSLNEIERTAVMLVGVDRTNPLKAPFEAAVVKAGASQGRSIRKSAVQVYDTQLLMRPI